MDRPSKFGQPLDPLKLTRVPATVAAEPATAAKLSPPALALLTKEIAPRQFLDALLARGLLSDATRFLAFALPPREAVWWACLSVRYAQPELPPEQELAVVAATHWVVEHTEARRQEAEPVANTASAAGYAAKAAAWTGGSLVAPSLPVVKPPPALPHEAALAAVSLAVASVPPDKAGEAKRHALALGIHIARGLHLWTATVPSGASPHLQTRRPPGYVPPRPRFT